MHAIPGATQPPRVMTHARGLKAAGDKRRGGSRFGRTTGAIRAAWSNRLVNGAFLLEVRSIGAGPGSARLRLGG